MIESSTMRRVCAVCAFAGMGLVPAALAQSEADEIETVPTIPVAALDPEDVPTEMDADTIELEELVVTAQKTRQTLREVPASVSAISGEQLAEAKIRHRIDTLVYEDGKGAFLGLVEGPGGETKPFFVWFEIANGKISRYTLRPL